MIRLREGDKVVIHTFRVEGGSFYEAGEMAQDIDPNVSGLTSCLVKLGPHKQLEMVSRNRIFTRVEAPSKPEGWR
jgi:hypothetical protein